jgi:hypothetical protein
MAKDEEQASVLSRSVSQTPRARFAQAHDINTKVIGLMLLGALGIAASVGPNLGLALIALLVLLVGLTLLWRPTEPPVLVFIFAYQWLEASLSTFYANYRGVPIDLTSALRGDMGLSTILSLIGLLSLAIGMRLGAGAPRIADFARIREQAERIPQRAWLYLYGGAYAVSFVAVALAHAVPGLSQPLLAFTGFKWAAYIAFTYVTFSRPGTNKIIWLVVFALEFVSALGNYFSSFKFVLIFTFLSLAFAGVRLSPARLLMLAICGLSTVFAGILWTAVKPEYRPYLSGGSAAQVVTVGYGERLARLGELVAGIDQARFRRATDELVNRIAYVDIFGLAVTYVPHYAPHTGGAVLGDSVARPFMPRLLFPSKPPIDESALTRQYTGVNFAGAREGTQVSMGYMADSYVDFGSFGMMGVIVLIGVALGVIHRWLLRNGSTAGLVGAGLSGAILLLTASSLGNSSAKLVGGVFAAVLMAWMVKGMLSQFLRSKIASRSR